MWDDIGMIRFRLTFESLTPAKQIAVPHREKIIPDMVLKGAKTVPMQYCATVACGCRCIGKVGPCWGWD